MSYIYEALQRAESERSGGSPAAEASSAADLLLAVEREIERKQSRSEFPPAESPLAELPPVELPATNIETEKTNSFGSAKALLPAPAAYGRLVCMTDQGCMAAEKFRVLGLKLRHLRERRKIKRIVITSRIPQEGKSMIASNLAL